MGLRLPSLLLLSLLHTWQCAKGESSYIIDKVILTLQPSKIVQSGTVVKLRCQVSVSYSNIAHLTHLFQLKRDDVLIHSSNTTEDTVTYELNPARVADSGSYECGVTVKDKNRVSPSQRLEVTGLQTPILHLKNLSPFEREEFNAICSAPEEKGVLTFRFYRTLRGGEPQILKQLRTTGNSLETTLKLSHVGDCFLSCDYELSLLSGTRRSNRSEEIQVIVKVLHIVPVMNVLPSTNVSEGDVMEVVCNVVESPVRNIEVFLTKDKRILKQATTALSHRFTAQAGDSGVFVCKAEWGSVQKESSKSITVKELFSKPRLALEPKEIFEGDRFILTCSISIYVPERINNKTIRFSFSRDNNIIRVVSSGHTYINLANPSQNGNYTCDAQVPSSSQIIVKESQILLVKAKVPVSEPELSLVGGTLVLGKPFQLLCHSNRGTLPITYSLHSPYKLNETRVVSRPRQKAIFNSTAIFKSSDLKNFLCLAKNSNHKPPMRGSGQQMLSLIKIIEPVSEPQLSILPRMDDITEGQNVTLVCSIQRGSLPITYTWYHIGTESPLDSQTYHKLNGSYNIHNIRGEHRGGYYCLSTNSAKDIKQSSTVIIGVKMASWKKGLIAAFSILIVLIGISAIVFKNRLLQFKRKRTGNLSVKSASTKAERLSLTQAEITEAANATPGMMGKSVWSGHVSDSESEDQNSAATPEPEPQYTEVQIRQVDNNRALVKQGADTVYSEVQNSQQGADEPADGVSVEYAELNRDTDHQGDPSNHGGHSADDVHINETDSSVSPDPVDHQE
ncbi:platelet endothelial cell adhesion molecule isoform 2-T2 [Pholidichthys leucotaenia]